MVAEAAGQVLCVKVMGKGERKSTTAEGKVFSEME